MPGGRPRGRPRPPRGPPQRRTVECTPAEFRILARLLAEPGRAFSRAQLLTEAFGFDHYALDRTVDVHVMNLRRKIEAEANEPRYLLTVYGVGYKMSRDAPDRVRPVPPGFLSACSPCRWPAAWAVAATAWFTARNTSQALKGEFERTLEADAPSTRSCSASPRGSQPGTASTSSWTNWPPRTASASP